MSKELSSYYTYLNQNLLDSLPKNLSRVLDIGCGGGMLGEAYKAENEKCVWHGIDIHKDAIKHAKSKIDAAWALDAEGLKPNRTMVKTPYDALVYGCSLEQFRYPKEALEQHLKLLKPDGKIIFCFTNVQHWSLMRHVISGHWDYDDRGLLHVDNKHLFTRKSFMQLLKDCSVSKTQMKRYSYENDPIFIRRRGQRLKTLQKLKEFCEDCKLYFNENDYRTYHYIMIAKLDN